MQPFARGCAYMVPGERKHLAYFHQRPLEFLPAHVEYFDDAAIEEESRDHPVTELLSGVVHDGKDGPLYFGKAVANVGYVRCIKHYLVK